MDIFSLGRRIVFLTLWDFLGNLSKERHQASFNVQEVKLKKGLHRDWQSEGVEFINIARKALEGDDHCHSQFVTCHFHWVSLFPCFRVSARRNAELCFRFSLFLAFFSLLYQLALDGSMSKLAWGKVNTPLVLLEEEKNVLSAQLILTPKNCPRVRPNVREELGWVLPSL